MCGFSAQKGAAPSHRPERPFRSDPQIREGSGKNRPDDADGRTCSADRAASPHSRGLRCVQATLGLVEDRREGDRSPTSPRPQESRSADRHKKRPLPWTGQLESHRVLRCDCTHSTLAIFTSLLILERGGSDSLPAREAGKKRGFRAVGGVQRLVGAEDDRGDRLPRMRDRDDSRVSQLRRVNFARYSLPLL